MTMILYDALPWHTLVYLDLQTREQDGTITLDHARFARREFTWHGGPSWRVGDSGVNYIDFEANTPKWLDCPSGSVGDLDFTSVDYTLAVWIKLESVGLRTIMAHGLLDTSGWEWGIAAAPNALFLRTNQAGANQVTYALTGAIPIAVWMFLVTTRSGAVVTHYINGETSIGTAAVHVDADSAAALELHVGIANDEATGPFDGSMYRPRIWSERVLTLADVKQLYACERGLLGV